MKELCYDFSCTGNSAPGKDGLPYQASINRFRGKLLELYNFIYSKGCHPNFWREAIVIPLPKSGKCIEKPESYRPISLTCCLGMLMKKMVKDRLVWFLESKNIFLSRFSMMLRLTLRRGRPD